MELSNWGAWHSIENIHHDIDVLHKQGLYQIRMVSPSNKPFRIPRLVGVDDGGIIYIGKSVELRTRIGNFYSGKHSGGGMYNLVRLKLGRHRPYKNYLLQYRYMKISDEKVMEDTERNVLRRYFRKYCELPPFNSTVPGGK
jgi:hypothetical protein